MIGVIATVQIKPGSELQFETLAKELIARSLEEPGCEDYSLWRTDDPSNYIFIERYRDDEAMAAHLKSEHFRLLGRQLGQFTQGPPTLMRLHAP